MDPSDVELEHENLVSTAIDAAETLLTEDRFGGAWIDRESRTPLLAIAMVEPTRLDFEGVTRAAGSVGWPVEIVAVRYPRKKLLEWLDRVNTAGIFGGAWVSLGWDARHNALVAHLRRADGDAIAGLRAIVPEDALRIVIADIRVIAA